MAIIRTTSFASACLGRRDEINGGMLKYEASVSACNWKIWDESFGDCESKVVFEVDNEKLKIILKTLLCDIYGDEEKKIKFTSSIESHINWCGFLLVKSGIKM